ncbi:MAG: ABC transporter permease [Vallitalea sp.]|jgi:ABC-2 type transport system permease protein|nr:ABC transporter permease [Vallitalea sp.]
MNKLLNILENRLKILFKTKMIIILVVIMLSLFILLVNTLYKSVDNSSRVPVAVVDNDLTDLSKKVVKNLKDDKMLRIVEYNKNKAVKELKNGKVEAVYILKKGLKDNINEERYKEIIDVYFLKGSTIAKFIGDIFAEKVLRDLCLIKSINLLERALDTNNIENKEYILADAYDYGISIQDYSNHQYYVKVNLVKNMKESIDIKKFDNSLIYKKMIFGIIISFISFFLLFASVSIIKDKETKLSSRIKISSTNYLTVFLGDFLSLIISGGMVSLLFSLINGIYVDEDNLILFIATFIILIMYVISISSLIMLFTSIMDKVAVHAMIFTILILIMGIVSGSFFSVDLLSNSFKTIAYLIPNYWTLNALVDIITVGINKNNMISYVNIMLIYTAIMTFAAYVLMRVFHQKYNH